jgi:hypothetical protein
VCGSMGKTTGESVTEKAGAKQRHAVTSPLLHAVVTLPCRQPPPLQLLPLAGQPGGPVVLPPAAELAAARASLPESQTALFNQLSKDASHESSGPDAALVGHRCPVPACSSRLCWQPVMGHDSWHPTHPCIASNTVACCSSQDRRKELAAAFHALLSSTSGPSHASELLDGPRSSRPQDEAAGSSGAESDLPASLAEWQAEAKTRLIGLSPATLSMLSSFLSLRLRQHGQQQQPVTAGLSAGKASAVEAVSKLRVLAREVAAAMQQAQRLQGGEQAVRPGTTQCWYYTGPVPESVLGCFVCRLLSHLAACAAPPHCRWSGIY